MGNTVALGKLGNVQLEVRDVGPDGWLLIARGKNYFRVLNAPIKTRAGRSGLVVGIEMIRGDLEGCEEECDG